MLGPPITAHFNSLLIIIVRQWSLLREPGTSPSRDDHLHAQHSVANRPFPKWAFKYFGPFPVVAKVGSVAYKLGLPSTSNIHPMFHVSQLKQVVGPSVEVAQLPVDLEGLHVPERVLQRRLGSTGSPQVLIQWSSLPSSLATWEDESAL